MGTPRSSAPPPPGRGWRTDELWALAFIAALLALRGLYLFTHGVDSDEPQNLHVVYRWWQGALPYRDQFDNHTPLLHWLFLPFAALVGENANVVVLARMALVPISFGAVALFFLLARRIFSRPVALWSVALTLALADWSLKSIEFRPDVLWMFFWFAALLLLVRPTRVPGAGAFFLAGVLLGASAAASVKTVFLLPALAIGWAGAWLLSPTFRAWYPWPAILRCGLAGAAGFAVVPGIVAAAFASQGALDEMAFCVYAINRDPLLTPRSWLFLAGLPPAIAVAAWLMRAGGARDLYRGAVFLAAAAYALTIVAFGPWESLAKQTFLPAYPLLLAAACHLVFTTRPWREGQVAALGGAACVGLAVAMMIGSPPFRDGTAPQRALLQAVLDHTPPGEPLMDMKGETVFRRRPVYLVYVGNTRREMEAGNLLAPEPAELTATRTAFAIERTSSFPAPMRDFLRKNYLSTAGGNLRAAGVLLKPSWEAGRWIDRVAIAIPGDYVITDGKTILGKRTVPDAAVQTFEFPDRQPRYLFWKAAWEAGLRPAGA